MRRQVLWMAPEILLGERYNEKIDVYAFAMVLLELISRQLPWQEAGKTQPRRGLRLALARRDGHRFALPMCTLALTAVDAFRRCIIVSGPSTLCSHAILAADTGAAVLVWAGVSQTEVPHRVTSNDRPTSQLGEAGCAQYLYGSHASATAPLASR